MQPLGPWTKRAAILAVVSPVLFAAAIVLLRTPAPLADRLGGAALLGAPLAAIVGVLLAVVALRRKERPGPARLAVTVNGLLAFLFVAFLVLLIQAIRTFN
ncbi:MAG: hypothetical protein AABX89_03500 [Candidatus Thermoplasmatota archaeon]